MYSTRYLHPALESVVSYEPHVKSDVTFILNLLYGCKRAAYCNLHLCCSWSKPGAKKTKKILRKDGHESDYESDGEFNSISLR